MDKTVFAIYLRLSREDGNKERGTESNSISAQRLFIKNHIESMMQGLPYSISEFCDDGYSGTGFVGVR